MDPDFPVPEALHYIESSLFGGTREIRVEKGSLTCTSGQGSEGGPAEKGGAPPQGTWPRLWDLLEELDAWHWSGYYGNLTVVDGVSWSLDISWKGRQLSAAGYHSWPGKDREFARLMTLLRRLAQGEYEGWVAGKAQLV